MRIQSPSLVELHAFLAVARTGSFRRAAQELCVTQAAVSRAVMRLEADMGQEVFLRTGSGVVLTGLGEELQRMTARPVQA
ncbi:MAG: LysR family transcriptional regulator, partial [Giesbergeria sp.]|nr:LysR family transcriptional regulator [Giesbergeria sp.]